MTPSARFGVVLLLASGCGLAQTAATPYVITTVAGGPPAGDNGAATSAYLRDPQFVAADAAGNFYFSEYYYVARKLTPGTIISTIPENPTSATGGGVYRTPTPWTAFLQGLTLDASGNLYFATNGTQIVEVAANGGYSLFAGINTYYNGFSGDGASKTLATFNGIRGIRFDQAGNLYVADRGDHVIRKIDTKGTITTFAGVGTVAGSDGDGKAATSAHLSYPTDVQPDTSGNVYIADTGNHRIRKVTADGIIHAYAGNGTAGNAGDGGDAAAAQLNNPSGLALDYSGRLYVADGDRVRQITATLFGTTVIGLFAGGSTGFSGDGGLAVKAQVNGVTGVTADAAGNVYIADTGNHRIRKVDANGNIHTAAGVGHFAGDNGPATSATLSFPSSVAVDAAGSVYIADSDNNSIRQIAVDGTVRTVAGTGVSGFTGDGLQAASAQLSNPQGVAVDSGGSLYIADTANQRIRKISTAGVITTVAGTGPGGSGTDGVPATQSRLFNPMGLALDAAGNLYIADSANNRVRMVSPQGIISTVAGTGTAGSSGDGANATAATLRNPEDVAVDSAGNLYIADSGNTRVRKVDSKGIITTFAGGSDNIAYADRCTQDNMDAGDGTPAAKATLGSVSSVAVDAAGNVFISSLGMGRIRAVNLAGVISTIAGTGNCGYSGDGGLATSATLGVTGGAPSGLAVGPGGVVYFTDYANEAVRKLAPNLPTQLRIVSGDKQSGPAGTLLPGQLVVSVLGPTGLAVSGATVSFAVSSGTATLSASSAVTGANGQAGVSLTLGANTGAVAVTATVTGLTPVTFNLTANLSPWISTGGVVGAGLSVPAVTALSGNAIVSIFGQNFTPAGSPLAMVGSGDLVGGKVPTQFAGVCVEINSVRAPIFAVSPGQVNLQVPAIPQSGKVTVQVITNCGQATETRSAAATVAVQAATPEFFFFTHNLNGQNAVAAINAVTAANVGTPNLTPGASYIPARPGDFVSIFMTGLGATNPSYDPGALAAGAAKVTAPVSVSLGGVPLAAANIPYVGVAPGNAGLYQLNIQIPAGAPSGNVPLAVTVGAFSTPAGGYLTIQPDPNCRGYSYSAIATIHHEYVVANADNYTVTIAGTWPTLAKVDSGGQVTSADGYDICFADAANTAKLSWEVESYNGGTGAIVD